MSLATLNNSDAIDAIGDAVGDVVRDREIAPLGFRTRQTSEKSGQQKTA